MTLILPFLLVSLSSRACHSNDQGSEQCVDSADCESTSSEMDAWSYLSNISRISIPSQGIRRDNGTTLYTLVLTLSDESVVQASRRYSEFDILRQQLTLIPSDGKFPGKQIYDWACTLVTSLQSCVESRRLGLETYMNRALHHFKKTADEARYSQGIILAKFMIKYSDDAYDDINEDHVADVVESSYSQTPLKKKSSTALKLDPSSALLMGAAKDDLINEYYDTNMGIAFTMVTKMSWEWGGHWGLASHPDSVPDGRIRHVSITTHRQDMSTYAGMAYGLIFHITPESNFWKHFLVKKGGKNAGSICGGPGDGRGGGASGVRGKLLPESMGKDYEWFTSEKERILAKYNTVYKVHDYNEFITMGTSKQALAGIFHYTKRRKYTPSDEQMCATLRHVRGGKWPIYAYDRFSLSIERYLNC